MHNVFPFGFKGECGCLLVLGEGEGFGSRVDGARGSYLPLFLPPEFCRSSSGSSSRNERSLFFSLGVEEVGGIKMRRRDGLSPRAGG